jgi:hypothetical protein
MEARVLLVEDDERQSPRTVETSVVVTFEQLADLVEPACQVGQAGPARGFLPEGSQRLGGQGHAEGVSRVARCEAPLRSEGRPRILRGLHKISGGAAASVVL